MSEKLNKILLFVGLFAVASFVAEANENEFDPMSRDRAYQKQEMVLVGMCDKEHEVPKEENNRKV